jgi:hypothetical protein
MARAAVEETGGTEEGSALARKAVCGPGVSFATISAGSTSRTSIVRGNKMVEEAEKQRRREQGQLTEKDYEQLKAEPGAEMVIETLRDFRKPGASITEDDLERAVWIMEHLSVMYEDWLADRYYEKSEYSTETHALALEAFIVGYRTGAEAFRHEIAGVAGGFGQ